MVWFATVGSGCSCQPRVELKSGGVVGYVCDFNRSKLKRSNQIAPLKSEKVSTTSPLFAAVQASNHITRSRVDLVNNFCRLQVAVNLGGRDPFVSQSSGALTSPKSPKSIPNTCV